MGSTTQYPAGPDRQSERQDLPCIPRSKLDNSHHRFQANRF